MGPKGYQPDPTEETIQRLFAERKVFQDRCNLLDTALANVHSQAMWHAHTADTHRQMGSAKTAHLHYWMALSIDKAIADSLPAIPGENGKAILCKSAAVLAMNCRFFDVAIEYANKGLLCVNCPVLAGELTDVRKDAENKDMAGYE